MEIRPIFTILKKAAVFSSLLLVSCSMLSAQKKQFPIAAEVWGGYSYVRFEATELGFNDDLGLNGWIGGVSLPDLYQGLGVAVDISGHYTTEMEEYNFLIGPQYSYKLKGMRFYGHGLFGKARDRLRQPGTTSLEPSDLHKAAAFGGGVDFSLTDRFSVRAIQADYLITNAFNTTQHNLRFSTGLIFRFGKR
jgi:hypothetical protein